MASEQKACKEVKRLLGLLYKYKRTFCEAKHKISSVFKFGRSASRSTPHLKLSSVADEVLADLCHFTESPFETVGRSTPVFTLRAHIHCYRSYRQIRWQIYPQVDLPVELQFQIFTVRAHMGRSTGRSTPQYYHLVVKNGDFILLLLELILAD